MPRRDRLSVLTCILIAALVTAAVAGAGFGGSGTGGPQTISAASLAAPSGLSATAGLCLPVPTWSQPVNLSWTATASGFADGQEVRRGTTNGGPYSFLASVAAGATTYTDNATSASTTYYYVVRATKLSWRSGNSNQASVTTKSALCL